MGRFEPKLSDRAQLSVNSFDHLIEDWLKRLTDVSGPVQHDVVERCVAIAMEFVPPKDRNPKLLYIAKPVGFRAIKIGVTANDCFGGKMSTISYGCPFPVVCVLAFLSTLNNERRLHEELAEKRLTGEWFVLDATVATFIREAHRAMVTRLLESPPNSVVRSWTNSAITGMTRSQAGVAEYCPAFLEEQLELS